MWILPFTLKDAKDDEAFRFQRKFFVYFIRETAAAASARVIGASGWNEPSS